ncbi:MAG: lysine--tRNA ligase [Bacteroidia bacterium]|nr:lysine--tRNA ligase [Bacteroidia bacterium]
MKEELNEQEIQRRKKLEEIRKAGFNAYPAALFDVNVSAKDILENYERNKTDYKNVSIAGRIMSMRDMGKACFVSLQDSSGRIQLYVRRDDIDPGEDKSTYDILFKKGLDIGDFIGITGFVFTTKTGEISIHATSLKLLSKALKPLPIVKTDAEGKAHDVVTDPEFRYRQRYADLIVNPGVKEVFIKRTQIINSLRNTFNAKGYLEVETPILQPIPGGASARPFITHHNTLDIPLYLRIANELYLKRLIVGGFDGVYEFAKDFRNEGMDRTHNPEFTVMEIYVAYKDYNWMMNFTEEMIEKVALDLYGDTKVQAGDKVIDFQRPFRRITMYDAIKEYAGVDISGMNEDELRKTCSDLGIHTEANMGKGKLVDEIFSAKCEHHFIQPTFIIDYPVEMSPLCKRHRSKEGLVERFELMVNGKELANAYSELNDPIDQRERFEDQLRLSQKGDDEAMFIDHDFLRALEYGMPPTSGMGLGIDRLTMIMTHSHSIQDVLLFPQMKPEVVKKPGFILTEPELKILSEVKLQGQATLVSLVEKLGISKNQLQKLMKTLEERKLVKREGPIYQPIN